MWNYVDGDSDHIWFILKTEISTISRTSGGGGSWRLA